MTLFSRNNKGQVSGFAILGIVIVAVIILLFFLRGQFGLVLPGGLGGKSTNIHEHFSDCLQEIAPPYFERIGLQGGYLSTPEGTFKLHQDATVSYLCYNIEGDYRCRNRMLTLDDMEDQLARAIDTGLQTCVDFGFFRNRGYDLTIGQRSTSVDIGPDAVIATVSQPLRLVKGDTVVQADTFTETFSLPLGRLYDVSQDIVSVEATAGEFDQLSYMLAHQGTYLIEKKRPYPDKLYILQTKDHPYTFQFFVEDEPTSS